MSWQALSALPEYTAGREQFRNPLEEPLILHTFDLLAVQPAEGSSGDAFPRLRLMPSRSLRDTLTGDNDKANSQAALRRTGKHLNTHVRFTNKIPRTRAGDISIYPVSPTTLSRELATPWTPTGRATAVNLVQPASLVMVLIERLFYTAPTLESCLTRHCPDAWHTVNREDAQHRLFARSALRKNDVTQRIIDPECEGYAPSMFAP